MSMKTLLIAAMAIGGVMYSDLNAQRGGGGGRGGGATARPNPGANPGGNRGGNFGGMGSGRLGMGRGGNGWNGDGWYRAWNNRFGGQGFGSLNYGWGYGANGWGYPAFYSDYAWPATYGDGNETPPSVVLVMPMPAPPELPPPPPPEPARPVIHEYAWPDAGGNPHATFSIASRDGVVRSAVAVWVQGSEVGFTAADGRTGRVTQAAIDCGATEKLNTQNKLRLSLPGCRSSQQP
jgi:hypothetical protein